MLVHSLFSVKTLIYEGKTCSLKWFKWFEKYKDKLDVFREKPDSNVWLKLLKVAKLSFYETDLVVQFLVVQCRSYNEFLKPLRILLF